MHKVPMIRCSSNVDPLSLLSMGSVYRAVIIFITEQRIVVLGFTFVFCIRFRGVMKLSVISILNALCCSENNRITSKWKYSSKTVFLVLLIGLF